MDAGKAKSIKIGKDKRAKDGDGKQLADGESCIDAQHWAKITTKYGGELKLLEALGVTDKRIEEIETDIRMPVSVNL